MLVFIIPLTAFAIMSWYEKKIEKLPVIGKSKSHQISNFSLTNQDGRIVTTGDWDGKIVIADFFFTHCPSICPKMTKNMKQLQDIYKDEEEIQLASFSVDPERDSSNRLKEYARSYGIENNKWDLLTGDKREIYKLARNSFMIIATDGDGGPADFIHSEKFILLDKAKRIRGYYDGTSGRDMTQLRNDIKKLKHED